MVLDWTVRVFVFLQIISFFDVIKEGDNAVGEKGSMWKISKFEFGEEGDIVTDHLEGAKPRISNQVDFDYGITEVGQDAFLKLFGQREISGFIVAGAPSVLFTVGADVYEDLMAHLI